MCTVQADLSGKEVLLHEKSGVNGIYWMYEYTIGLQLGGTELEAFVEWYEGVKLSHCIQLVYYC
jgi:hypothetical protein